MIYDDIEKLIGYGLNNGLITKEDVYVIRNEFMKRVEAGERLMGPCRHCVKTCKPATTPYCISQALINAALGKVEEGLIFCGGHVDRVKEIVSVEDVMRSFA